MATQSSQQNRPAGITVKKKLLFSSVILLPFTMLLCVATLMTQSYQLYRAVKLKEHGWRGHVFAVDPVLGFAPVSHARGAELLPAGREISARLDGDGFRIPEDEKSVAATGNPRAIAFGCSFTYGAACTAEETYAYQLSQALGFRCLNAGVPSYGLAQILIIARRLIPKIKPDYVIVQYSPWLVDRSQSYYAPAHYGRLTNPYFTKTAGGGVTIHPPAFQEKVTELSVSAYRDTQSGVSDYASFVSRVGLPLYFHDDLHAGMLGFKRAIGLSPPPCTDGQLIVDAAYGEIAKLCNENGATMIILILGAFTNQNDRHSLARIRGARVVDAHSALLKRLPMISFEDYARAYCHWRGNDPKLIDAHPNPRAHWIITCELTAVIREIEVTKQQGSASAQDDDSRRSAKD